ncbi:MAG TPA: zinc ribbon domain-containing protein, partial [Actinomycetota bacterium]|nr:zinc ribbon domain-containing protein [Actinomycetota bacterium]
MAGIVCPSCSAINAADQRFCTTCGSALGVSCPSCGAVNAPDARFCGTCGSSLLVASEAPASEPHGEERKIVSVLFADLVGSTADADGADPEDVRARLRPYYACVRDEIESFGGTVEKFIGDAVVGALEALNEEDPELRLAVRVAVDTGEAVV